MSIFMVYCNTEFYQSMPKILGTYTIQEEEAVSRIESQARHEDSGSRVHLGHSGGTRHTLYVIIYVNIPWETVIAPNWAFRI